jgi:endonuclease YncB( thermonuclease family)
VISSQGIRSSIFSTWGGEITSEGDVVLPDALLFSAGEATLTQEMSAFLRGFCRPWFEILYEAGSSLSSIQIEGHASSEWQQLEAQDAYIKNLALSQARARTVFEYCLRLVGDDAIGSWAREKLAAVGYSSARKIMVGGKEDRARSRRVVFNINADRSLLFERFDFARTSGGLGPDNPSTVHWSDKSQLLSGIVTHVRDGDTIVVGNTPIRLAGLHAPELNESGGPSAAAAMREMVEGRRVECLFTGERSYDREVAICKRAGVDLAETMVRRGLARDCPRFSHGNYAAFEQADAQKFELPDYCLE